MVLLARRHDAAPPAAAALVRGSDLETAEGTAARLASLEAVGEAMLDAGYSVTGVRSALVDIAEVNGYPDAEPTEFIDGCEDIHLLDTSPGEDGRYVVTGAPTHPKGQPVQSRPTKARNA